MKRLLCLIFLMPVAYAGDIVQSNDNNAQTTGDVSTALKGSDSFALASALGDVDIGDCLASKQISILIVWQQQWVVENPLCVARELDIIGAYEAAAKVRCATKTLKATYPIESECILAVTAREREVVVPEPRQVSEDEHVDLEPLEARITALEADTAQAQESAKNAVRAAQRQPQTVIRREEFIDAEKRAKLAELRGEK